MGPSNGDEPGSYDPETQTYRRYHDWESNDRVSTVIIEAVAAVTDTPPTNMGPLYEVVDPDALNHLFPPLPNGSRCQAERKITFTLNECDITVYGDGLIEIQLPTEN